MAKFFIAEFQYDATRRSRRLLRNEKNMRYYNLTVTISQILNKFSSNIKEHKMQKAKVMTTLFFWPHII